MSLYEDWISRAYTQDGKPSKKHWSSYKALETAAFKRIIEGKLSRLEGSVSELAGRFGMSDTNMVGFIDGMNECIEPEQELEEAAADTAVCFEIDFKKLFKRMVELKADYLYTLPEWDAIFSEDERNAMAAEQKASKTVVRTEAKIGRNDPCPCGSGRKYKACCISSSAPGES